MNLNTLTTLVTGVGSFLGLLITLWAMLIHFDKRNADRFESLQRQTESTEKALCNEITSSKEVLRAEMKELRAEVRLEIRDAGDRRLIT